MPNTLLWLWLFNARTPTHLLYMWRQCGIHFYITTVTTNKYDQFIYGEKTRGRNKRKNRAAISGKKIQCSMATNRLLITSARNTMLSSLHNRAASSFRRTETHVKSGQPPPQPFPNHGLNTNATSLQSQSVTKWFPALHYVSSCFIAVKICLRSAKHQIW